MVSSRRAQGYLMATALFTILSGIALFARMESLTDGGFSRTAPGMAFGIGGLAGVAALLTGALVNGPAARRLAQLGARLRTESRLPSTDEAARMGRLQTRTRWPRASPCSCR
jgi:hypothetical protein